MQTRILIACLLLCTAGSTQIIPTNNLLLGYQEFPTTIFSHTPDGIGNQFYAGTFRGQLLVNNQVLTNGNGLEDFFWVKTDANGQVVRYKTYGSTNVESAFFNAFAMGSGGHMLFAFATSENMSVGGFNVIPYTIGGVNYGAVVIVYSDTAGTVSWVRKTNLSNARIYYANGIFHFLGIVQASSPPIRFDNTIVTDSIAKQGIVDLMISETGTLLGVKKILPRKTGQVVTFITAGTFSDNNLLLQFRVDGDSSFNVNDTVPIKLPNTTGSYHLLMKTDSSYASPLVKNLNPFRHPIGTVPGTAPAMCMGPNDSVYLAFSYDNFSPSYNLDSFFLPTQRNGLFVLDSTLTVKRQVILGSTFAGYYAQGTTKRRIYIRQLLVQNGQLYINGVYFGINESPLNVIPNLDTVVSILPGLNTTVNQNGPSRSFMAKCQLDGFGGSINWYGEHTEYESSNVAPTYMHAAGLNRVVFHNQVDNVWNPWVFDQNLNILSGAMRRAADYPELPQMIRFFDDGSRIVIGYARGKTALDSNGTFISNAFRRDIFIVRLKANNDVAWFKRFHSTLISPDIRGLEVRNGKAWFLVDYGGAQNDSNYLRIGSITYNVRLVASVLANIDTAGNINLLNLTNPILKNAYLRHFSFFTNGDLLVGTDPAAIAYQNFPIATGPQLFRLNPATGAIIDARKIYGTPVVVFSSLQVDQNDQIYIGGYSSYPGASKIYLHDGNNTIDTTLVVGNTTNEPTYLKMNWNHIYWLKRLSGTFTNSGRQYGDLVLSNNKPVVSGFSVPGQQVFWDGQFVNNGSSNTIVTLLRLDGNGTMTSNKSLPNVVSVNYIHSGSNGQIYISGTNRSAIQVDTIAISCAGSLDALSLVLDSGLVAKRSFRVASPYSEFMYDMDIRQDSIVALVYLSQTPTQVYLNKMTVADGDLQEDGYVGTYVAKPNNVTSVTTTLPMLHLVALAPNPIQNGRLALQISVPENLKSEITIYNNTGQFIGSAILQLVPGSNRYQVKLPNTLAKGTYYVLINNKRWSTTRSFVVL